MSVDDFKKEDLRIRKTRTAIINAMLSLLKRKTFNRITVNDLCEEALVSRAAFYVHFDNKFELIKYWIDTIINESEAYLHNDTEEQMVAKTMNFMSTHKQVLANLVDDDHEDILKYFFDSLAGVVLERFSFIKDEKCCSIKSDIILLEFFSGGMMHLFLWQVKNKDKMDRDLIADYLF